MSFNDEEDFLAAADTERYKSLSTDLIITLLFPPYSRLFCKAYNKWNRGNESNFYSKQIVIPQVF